MAQRTIPTPPGLDEQGNPVDTKTPPAEVTAQ
jgi:hypothetical protein